MPTSSCFIKSIYCLGRLVLVVMLHLIVRLDKVVRSWNMDRDLWVPKPDSNVSICPFSYLLIPIACFKVCLTIQINCFFFSCTQKKKRNPRKLVVFWNLLRMWLYEWIVTRPHPGKLSRYLLFILNFGWFCSCMGLPLRIAFCLYVRSTKRILLLKSGVTN